ncbi:hypothetical protein C8F04DRAFT_1332458 [Mycena alexandri]|uniref:Uncharacterized protein n=1 Tax=Mycena alexandri TaxID=1745969 RepID=A0AAD6WQY8_9AGAR|nr:hypothetical protein C8F04DRAFT_1332458 [Mycena alexandri]
MARSRCCYAPSIREPVGNKARREDGPSGIHTRAARLPALPQQTPPQMRAKRSAAGALNDGFSIAGGALMRRAFGSQKGACRRNVGAGVNGLILPPDVVLIGGWASSSALSTALRSPSQRPRITAADLALQPGISGSGFKPPLLSHTRQCLRLSVSVLFATVDPAPAGNGTNSDTAAEEQLVEDECIQCVLIEDDVVPHANTHRNLRAYTATWRDVSALSPVPAETASAGLANGEGHASFGFPAPPAVYPTLLWPIIPSAHSISSSCVYPRRRATHPLLRAYLAAPTNGYAHVGLPWRFVHLVGLQLDVALDARGSGGHGALGEERVLAECGGVGGCVSGAGGATEGVRRGWQGWRWGRR